MRNLSTAGHQVGDWNGVPLEWKSEGLSREPPCSAKCCHVSEHYLHLKRDAVYSGRAVATFRVGILRSIYLRRRWWNVRKKKKQRFVQAMLSAMLVQLNRTQTIRGAHV